MKNCFAKLMITWTSEKRGCTARRDHLGADFIASLVSGNHFGVKQSAYSVQQQLISDRIRSWWIVTGEEKPGTIHHPDGSEGRTFVVKYVFAGFA